MFSVMYEESFMRQATYLNIGRLKIDEKKIASDETNGNPNSESEKPKNSTEKTHL